MRSPSAAAATLRADRLGTIVATRRLARGSKQRPVLVRLGKPRHRRTGEWACPYRIQGVGSGRTRQVFGEDAVQALQLALEAIRLELEPFRHELTCFGGEPGELFFPRYVPYSFGQRFADRLGALLDDELRREARRIRERARRRSKRRKRSRESRGAPA